MPDLVAGALCVVAGQRGDAVMLLRFWKMPELTGHSLEDIEHHLVEGRFRPADLAKR